MIARSQGSDRRPVNDPAIAALLGTGLIIWSAGGLCMVVLMVVTVVAARRWLWRLIFPDERVGVWHYDMFDHELRGVYGVVIYDAVGMPPGEQSLVRIRGRRGRNVFRATQILRELDANGAPVLGRDGLIARQFPPTWVGIGLLACGILLLALRWLAVM